jgi:hypothetical protein
LKWRLYKIIDQLVSLAALAKDNVPVLFSPRYLDDPREQFASIGLWTWS